MDTYDKVRKLVDEKVEALKESLDFHEDMLRRSTPYLRTHPHDLDALEIASDHKLQIREIGEALENIADAMQDADSEKLVAADVIPQALADEWDQAVVDGMRDKKHANLAVRVLARFLAHKATQG